MNTQQQESIRHHFPDQFEQQFKVKVLPTKATSVAAYYQHWLKKHDQQLIEIEAWSVGEGLPVGHTLVKAAINGDEQLGVYYYAVDNQRYAHRGEFGYVIQHDDTEMVLASESDED